MGFYVLINKSDIYSTFIGFKKMVENRFNRTIKMLQMDGGGEFTSKLFLDFLLNNAIGHQISCPYTAQQNGIVNESTNTSCRKAFAYYHNNTFRILIGFRLFLHRCF